MIVVIEPLILLALIIFAFVVWPPIAPYIVWIPYVGSALGGEAATNAQSKGSRGVLTRRLEKVCSRRYERGGAYGSSAGAASVSALALAWPRLALPCQVVFVRAAGEASKISPDAALVAFGTEAVSNAATAAVVAAMERVHDVHKTAPPSRVRSGCVN